jgi:hypothetical protein
MLLEDGSIESNEEVSARVFGEVVVCGVDAAVDVALWDFEFVVELVVEDRLGEGSFGEVWVVFYFEVFGKEDIFRGESKLLLTYLIHWFWVLHKLQHFLREWFKLILYLVYWLKLRAFLLYIFTAKNKPHVLRNHKIECRRNQLRTEFLHFIIMVQNIFWRI